MKTFRSKLIGLGLVAITAMTACKNDAPNGLVLRIVGDSAVSMQRGWQQNLTVRYEDLDGNPVVGTIDFDFDGDAAGSELSDITVTTDENGRATVTLTAGQFSAIFSVKATAESASSVKWTVNVLERLEIDLAGTYDIDSELDLVSGIPGAAGDIVNFFIDLSSDPGASIIELITSSEAIRNTVGDEIVDFIGSISGALALIIDTWIDEEAPQFVDSVFDIGQIIGEITREAGLRSTLEIAEGATGFEARHSVYAVRYKWQDEYVDQYLADLSIPQAWADGIEFTYNGENRATIGGHELGVAFGAATLAVINEVVLPQLSGDPQVDSLLEYVQYVGRERGSASCQNDNGSPRPCNLCEVVGRELDGGDSSGSFAATLYTAACVAALDYAIGEIEDKILEWDASAFKFEIDGSCRLQGTGDRIQRFTNGTWLGNLNVAGARSPLSNSTFSGIRRQGD